MKEFYHKLFYVPKHEKISERFFLSQIILCIITTLMCLIILCSVTFAYFNASIFSAANIIAAANYDLTITDSQGILVSGTYLCPLAYEDLHTFTLTENGSAHTGYCKITVTNAQKTETYYTTQISNGASSITITIMAAEGSTITFVPQWGTPSNLTVVPDQIYENGTTIHHSNTPYTTHVIAEGETLIDIAVSYNTTIEAICQYNDLTQDAVLNAGQQIAIPEAKNE